MENLNAEKIIKKNDKIALDMEKEKIENKNDFNNSKEKLLKDKNNENEEKQNNKEDIFSTGFAEKIELTEDERNLRKKYLKKVTKKEAIIRSIILGRNTYYSQLFNFLVNMLYNILNFKITKFKSDAINAITEKDLDKFMIAVKYSIIALILNKILSIFDHKIFQYLTKNNDSKNIMLENLLFKKDMEFFDLFKTGELHNKVSSYNNYPYFNIIDTCSRIGESIFKLFYFGYYLYKDFFEMSLITIVALIVQNLLEPYIYESISSEEMIERAELRANYMNDILANIRLIKTFCSESKELNRLKNLVKKMKEKSFLKNVLEEINNALYNVNEMMIFYICGKKSITGKMDYGTLLIFQGYSSEFKGCISSIREQIKSINEGINTWIEFLQIYDIEQKIVSKKNIIPEINENDVNKKKVNGLSIHFKNISFAYPTKKNTTIIKNLDLKVKPGKTIAIVGSSGSGKSTLTNLLLRFYDVNNGEILINGINIKDLNLNWLRNKIGIVSQEPVLTSGTIKENILYGVNNYTEKDFIEVCKLANVYSFVTDKKLFPKEFDTIVGERGIKVSGGQKQRIAIARALMKDAKILIFDEATSALDSENEAIVQESINNIINQKKITTIIIAHRLSTVKNANVIYVMNHGKIVEFGTHDELILKDGEYKKLIQRQLVH